MSTPGTLIPAPFAQPIAQTMINNPTINMFSTVNHIHNTWTNADAFKRLFEQICVDAFAKSGLYEDMKCHPGTREVILERLENWVAAPGNADRLITWLDGPMGSGKTSVAVTMAGRASAKNKLIGSFVFRRGQPRRNEDTHFVATLAYQMALSIPLVRPFIEEQISQDYSILHQSLSQQLDALILTPLRKMRSQNPDINVTALANLIIVDGLDECDPEKKDENGEKRGKEEQQLGVLELLHRLALAQDVLPFAILVHSRPEIHIKHWFNRDHHASITNRFTLDSSYNPSDDIRLFVTQGLLSLLDTHPLCFHLRGTKWPYDVEVLITDSYGEEMLRNAIDLIVERSEGLFVYASIMLRFISSKGHQPAERLLQILETRPALHNTPASPYSTLDALYIQILDSISNPQVGRRILKLNYLISRISKQPADLPPLSILLDLISISMHDFDYFIQQSASILTYATEAFLGFQHSSLAEFLTKPEQSQLQQSASITLGTESKFLIFQHSSLAEFLEAPERSQHWCIHYETEIAHGVALKAIKSFSIGAESETPFFYPSILTAALFFVRNLDNEDWWSSDLVNELNGFFDFRNSAYRTPVLQILTSSQWDWYLDICFDMFVALQKYWLERHLKEWVYTFGSHIRPLFKPHIERYLKNPRTFAVFMCEAFGIPASNTDYIEDIPPPPDGAIAFGNPGGPDWDIFFRAPEEFLLHAFSIPNLEFLREAFRIVLMHAGRPSVKFDQDHQIFVQNFISVLDQRNGLSQKMWFAILDCNEYFTPSVRGRLHRKFLDYQYRPAVRFRGLLRQHQSCPNPILPFEIALGNCYWEPPTNARDIWGNPLWFLKDSEWYCQQILIPSVPLHAQYMANCRSTRGPIPLPKYDVHCPCSGVSCFDKFPKWMRS